jgi:5-methylcytosine-specific restriction endonuclease McrA
MNTRKGYHINVGKNNPSYKDGRTMKKYFCKCGNAKSIYKSKRCQKCYVKTLSGKSNPSYKGLIRVKCFTCKKSILIYPYQLKHNQHNYCNKQCYNDSPILKLLMGINSPTWTGGKSICIDCGNRAKSYKVKRCKSCNERFHKLGKKNPMYIDGNGKEPYNQQWNEKLKTKILKRDSHKCQLCNKTQTQELKDLKKKLSIHHIDYNKKNCKEDNLITLCHKCHNKTNTGRDYWYVYFTYIMEN